MQDPEKNGSEAVKDEPVEENNKPDASFRGSIGNMYPEEERKTEEEKDLYLYILSI